MANSAEGGASDYNTEIIREFRANQGRVGGPWEGVTLILIHHIGARSGIERVIPVAYHPQPGGRFAIWAANGGSPTHPNWYYNLRANPRITAEAGGETFTVLAQELDGTARAGLWPELVSAYPQLGDVQAKTTRQFPVFVLTPEDTVPGRSGALTASPSEAVPAANGPAGGKPLSATDRTRHRRFRQLGRPDRESLYAVLNAGLVAHLGVINRGWPMVIPTCYGFTADTLYLHGSVASQSLNTAGTPVCVTITLTDAVVLARSVFEHTINYRSAMIYGQPRLVTDPAELLAGLRCITEHVAPGQWDYARQPSRKELAAVRLLALPLEEASVKIRTGPPDDGDSPDAALGLWAGELPLATAWQQPVPDPALPPGIPVPAHISSRAGTRAEANKWRKARGAGSAAARDSALADRQLAGSVHRPRPEWMREHRTGGT